MNETEISINPARAHAIDAASPYIERGQHLLGIAEAFNIGRDGVLSALKQLIDHAPSSDFIAVGALLAFIADNGDDASTNHTRSVFDAIAAERGHQHLKWGADHDREHTPFDWARIICDLTINAAEDEQIGTMTHSEIIKVAATAIAWIEAEDDPRDD